MRTSITLEPVNIRGQKRYQIVARTTYNKAEGGGKTVSVAGDWRNGYTLKSNAQEHIKTLRQMVREGVPPQWVASHFELSSRYHFTLSI